MWSGARATRTNVVQFRDAYRGDPGEVAVDPAAGHGAHWYYITGAGRDDPRSGPDAIDVAPDFYNKDLADGNLTGERVLFMAGYLFDYLERLRRLQDQGQQVPETVNLDLVGFSRGAAEARIFANLVDRFLAGADAFVATDGIPSLDSDDVIDFTTGAAKRARTYLQDCTAPSVNLRFLGLWDTVSHLGAREWDDAKESAGKAHGDAYLAIPERVDHAAHAVAANERRAIFDSYSILERPGAGSAHRVERSFLGAHSDIGGGYANSDLSDVAFMWMVKQAEDEAGVPAGVMDRGFISDPRRQFNIVTDPIANDPVYDFVPGFSELYEPGRIFRYLDSGGDTDIKQDDVSFPEGADNLDFETAVGFLEKDIYQDEDKFGLGRGDDGLDQARLRQDSNGVYPYERWLRRNYEIHIELSEHEKNQ